MKGHTTVVSPARPVDRNPALSLLRGFHRPDGGNLWTGLNAAEILLHPIQGPLRVEVPGDDRNGVVWGVVGLVVSIEVVPGNCLQVTQGSYHSLTVGM